MSTVAATLAQGLAAKRAAKLEAYLSLVRSVVDQEDIDQDEAEETLLAAGKSAEDLDKDTKALVHRKNLGKKVAEMDGVEEELLEIRKSREKVQIAFEQHQRSYHEALAPLMTKENELLEKVRQGKLASRELIHTAGSGLQTRQKELDVRRRNLETTTKELRDKIDAFEAEAVSNDSMFARLGGDFRDLADLARGRARQARKELDALAGESANITVEWKSLEKLMLVP
jgi:hypothetical protein